MQKTIFAEGTHRRTPSISVMRKGMLNPWGLPIFSMFGLDLINMALFLHIACGCFLLVVVVFVFLM